MHHITLAGTLSVLTLICTFPHLALNAGENKLSQQRPSFQAGVDIVSINVTVIDEGGRYITDLDVEDFGVFENGIQQDLTFFTREQLPIALALLIDTSASMERRLSTAQEAAIGFARQLRQADLASVIDFDNRVNILQEFTNKPDALERAIRRTSAGGSTSLHNAIYIALKELQKNRPRVSMKYDVSRLSCCQTAKTRPAW